MQMPDDFCSAISPQISRALRPIIRIILCIAVCT